MFAFHIIFSEKRYRMFEEKLKDPYKAVIYSDVNVFIDSDSYYRHDAPEIHGDDISVLLFEHWVKTNQTTTRSGFPIELVSMSACELETALQAGQAKKEIFYVRHGEIDKDDKPAEIPPGILV